MGKIMQNLVVLMEPNERAYLTSLRTGNMFLNRFCIDEDAAFELSGVNHLKKASSWLKESFYYDRKGKEYSRNYIHSYS